MRTVVFAFCLLFALPVYALAPVQNVTSPSGIKAWLIEDHTNPVVSVRLAFRGGAALDPQGKEGLARLVSATMDEGAGKWGSQAFQSRLEDLSATLRFDASMDSFGAHVMTLRENLDSAMEMLQVALTQPRFDAEPVERMRSQLLSDLRQRQEDPDSVAGLTLYKTVLGDHVYARGSKGTLAGMEALTQGDLHQFVKQRIARDNLVIGVAGDMTPEELSTLLERTFAMLPAHATPWQLPKAALHLDNTPVVVSKSVPQSSILFMQEGIDRHDKDFYAAYVLNYILGGGGFASRLYDEVREKRGLVYSVYSYLANYDEANLWIIGAGTQNARVKETLDVVRAEWKKAFEKGVTQEEVKNAKTFLTGSFALRFSSSDSIASILLGMQMDHLPIDFLEQRNKQVEAVTLEDVQRMAKALLTPDKLKVVVVGQPAGV